MSALDHFLFGVYPYIALAIFFFGSLARFEREQYSWKTDSSQMLYAGQLRIGNILFHVGILGLFFGHFVGLLTPVAVWDALGVSHGFKQMVAVVMGGIFGISALIGMVILLVRRLGNPRIRAVTKAADKLVSLWILLTLLLGLSTIFISVEHTDGHLMLVLMTWAQHIVTFQGGTAELMAQVPLLFKAHLFMGMTLFVIFPFTRLVHVWSGFGALTYITRAWQLVRTR